MTVRRPTVRRPTVRRLAVGRPVVGASGARRAARVPAAPVLAALVLAVLVACSGPVADPARDGGDPATLADSQDRRPAESLPAPTVPAGSVQDRCLLMEDVDSGSGTLVTVVVPRRWRLRPGFVRPPYACDFGDTALGNGVRVSVAEESLDDYRERDLDPYEGSDGDDGVDRIERRDGLTVAGLPAESLSYTVHNDGAPQDVIVWQAAGVRVTWLAVAGTDGGVDPQALVESVRITEDAPRTGEDGELEDG